MRRACIELRRPVALQKVAQKIGDRQETPKRKKCDQIEVVGSKNMFSKQVGVYFDVLLFSAIFGDPEGCKKVREAFRFPFHHISSRPHFELWPKSQS